MEEKKEKRRGVGRKEGWKVGRKKGRKVERKEGRKKKEIGERILHSK